MDQRKIKKIINFLKDALQEKRVEAEKIIVFGSQIQGTAAEDSDLDVIVISQMFTGKDIFQRAEMINGVLSKVIQEFMVPLDLMMMSPEEWKKGTSLIAQFAREGEVFYPKSG